MFLEKEKVSNAMNHMQRKDAEDSLNEYRSKIKWHPDGTDSLLHIGSYSGDVLFDYIFPILPRNFKKLVGIDVSPAIISLANDNYRHPKLTFEQADIDNQGDVERILSKYGQFDHITSLYSLQWVMDQEQAFKNIFDLLVPNGDILITICQDNPLYQHYREMMAEENRGDYQQQMLVSTSPYFGSSDPVAMFRKILESVGFKDIDVEVQNRQFNFEKHVFVGSSTNPVAPLLYHVPDNLSTYENKVMKMSENDCNNVSMSYRMLKVYAKKGNNNNITNLHHSINTTKTIQKQAIFKNGEVRMHNAGKYHDTNCMQRKDALDTIVEYQHIFQWTPEGNDTLLDIGAGSGDVTYDYILPMVPSKSRIVASDKSTEMVEYASTHYAHPTITYEKLDIENENDFHEILKKYGQFRHVTSFYCLHWALNQYDVMENIFQLLQPGGDVLMTICQHHPLYEHYADMAELPKWSMYRSDMKKSTTPYFRNENPEKELSIRMEQAGFVDIIVVLKRRMFPFDSQVFIDSTAPVAPFLDKISETLKDEFLQIYINKVLTMKLPAPYKSNNERNDGKTIVPFCMLVAYGRKPTTNETI